MQAITICLILYFIDFTFIVIVTNARKDFDIFHYPLFLERIAMSYTLNNFIAVVFMNSSLENIQHFHIALP